METGCEMVIRDCQGECIAFRTLHRDPLMLVDEGEAWGVLEAINWAVALGFQRVIIETDAKLTC